MHTIMVFDLGIKSNLNNSTTLLYKTVFQIFLYSVKWKNVKFK
jgi:hypothetical protein